jgi:hypothetical protein
VGATNESPLSTEEEVTPEMIEAAANAWMRLIDDGDEFSWKVTVIYRAMRLAIRGSPHKAPTGEAQGFPMAVNASLLLRNKTTQRNDK